MPNGTYGGVRGRETKVGQKTFVSRPTRLKSVTASLSEEVETRGCLKAVLRQCLPQSLSPASQTSNSATMKKYLLHKTRSLDLLCRQRH